MLKLMGTMLNQNRFDKDDAPTKEPSGIRLALNKNLHSSCLVIYLKKIEVPFLQYLYSQQLQNCPLFDWHVFIQ